MAETVFAFITPANNSGVLALARATLDGIDLTVDVAASGLTPGEPHSLHLHGFLDNSPERAAVSADDADGDGFVETSEGESSAYGQVIAGLTATGHAVPGLEVSPDFPVAAAGGTLHFSQTYVLDPAVESDATILDHLNARFDGRFLEFHGLDLPAGAGAGTVGEVNGAGGYIAAVPVAEGQLFATTMPGIDARAATWLASTSATFLDQSTAALSLLAPYTLNTTGTGPAAPEPAGAATPPTDIYAAILTPSNGSGALGVSLVTLDRAAASVTVDLVMTGLTPYLEHAAHIHGFADGSPSLLPNFQLDADHDGFVEDAEGETVVAPVALALTDDGTVSNAATGLDFPNADASGAFHLHQTYDFNEADPAQVAIFSELTARLTGREVQVHGLFVPETEGDGTPGEVNGTAGYKATLPVANGILLPVTDAPAVQALVALGTTLEHIVVSQPSPLDWNAIGAQVEANYDATGHWFL